MASDIDVSRFMSLVLRHAPEQAGLVLDETGWTDFLTLCIALEARFGISETDVRRIVEESPKKRFVLLDGLIRAAQGHSIPVDLRLQAMRPPERLYHGSKAEHSDAILASGLLKGERNHVHLSTDLETARQVASRRKGESVIFEVRAFEMHVAGAEFFLSENGVWLTDTVPPNYLLPISETIRP